ncbi:MAG: hypothetical protein J5742_02300 [Alphaproteobacteria bacterium]|nr:hypothetical protein [Alphaproteobacteria bacterium]
MAKNKFDIQVIMTHGDEDINPMYGDVLPGFTISQLPLINEKINLGKNLRLNIIGDIDVRNIINKSGNFDDSYFPWLVIRGNFYCSKYSKRFPRIVCGTFDCSRLGKDYITKDTFLPATYEINCSFSISDFDVLIDILPDMVETLVVEPRLIKKSVLLKDEEHLKKTLAFIETHPNVTVLDTNGNNLLNILQEIDRDFETKELQKQVEQVQSATQTIQETFEIKIQGKHLDIKEIFAHCRELVEYESLSDDVLERYIRNVLSDQRKNGIQKKMMHRADGVIVVCINAEQLDSVCQDLSNLIQDRTKETIEEKTEEKSIRVQQSVEIKKETKTIKPIEIKKYIKQSQFKEIVKASGENNAYKALSAINEVNLDPLDMQFEGSVHIIKDGKQTVSATVKKESGCCIVQSIDSSNHNDRKRIVWNVSDGPDGLIIVCVGFSEYHDTKKTSDQYVKLRGYALKKQTYTQSDLIGYMNVNDMLKDSKYDGGKSDDTQLPKSDILPQKLGDFLEHQH